MKSKSVFSLIVVIVLFGGIYGYCFDEKLDSNGDNAAYYLLGKGLSQGKGYVNYYRIPVRPENHFPPGYPSFIAAIMASFDVGVLGVKMANGALFFMVVLLFYFLVKQVTADDVRALVIALAVLFNPHLIRYSTIIMSEMLFTFLSLATLLLVMQYERMVGWKRPSLLIFSVFVIVAAYYVRSIGVALLFTLVFYLLRRQRWQASVSTFGLFLLGILPWVLRSRSLGGNNYIDQLLRVNPYRAELGYANVGDFFARAINNVQRYASREFTASLFQIEHLDYQHPADGLTWIAGLILMVFIILGILKLPRFRGLLAAYFLAYVAILMTWPDVWMGPRFLVPVIPLIILFTFNGMKEMLFMISKKWIQVPNSFSPGVMILALIVFMGCNFRDLVILDKMATMDYQQEFRHYLEAAKWVEENSAEDAVISCRKGNLFHMFSNRSVTGYRRSTSEEQVLQGWEENGVDFVILDELGFGSSSRYFKPVMKKYPDKLLIVKQIEGSKTFVAQFLPELGYWGEFRNGKRNGFGSYRWANGQCFDGRFSGGLAHGQGELNYSDGRVLKGNWDRGRISGQVMLYDTHGRLLPNDSIEKDSFLIQE